MELSREEVRHIATLCRIAMTEEEVERFRHHLSRILEHFQVLQRVDVAHLPPTGHLGNIHTVMREDRVTPSYDREEVLANAPHREGDCFRVRAVLEE